MLIQGLTSRFIVQNCKFESGGDAKAVSSFVKQMSATLKMSREYKTLLFILLRLSFAPPEMSQQGEEEKPKARGNGFGNWFDLNIIIII